MTSITYLYSSRPVPEHSGVLREQLYPPPPPPQSISDHIDGLPQLQPSISADNARTGNARHARGENGSYDRKGQGQRALSTSKRAVQNRVAQRAFRLRKEGYVKRLEEQLRDYPVLSGSFKAVQAENHQLRDYISNLQSQLLESQAEVPLPPVNTDRLQPSNGGPTQNPRTLSRLVNLDAVSQPRTHQESTLGPIRPAAGRTKVKSRIRDKHPLLEFEGRQASSAPAIERR